MDAPAACAVPFRSYSGGVTRTRSVSEHMLVLALCLVLNQSLFDEVTVSGLPMANDGPLAHILAPACTQVVKYLFLAVLMQ